MLCRLGAMLRIIVVFMSGYMFNVKHEYWECVLAEQISLCNLGARGISHMSISLF